MWRKRGIYYARVELPGGQVKVLSLRTKDRDLAIARRAQLELTGDADWLPAKSRTRTIAAATRAFLDVAGNSRAEETVRMCRQKAAHIIRILGDRPVAAYRRAWTHEYIEIRREEGASRHTIAKELTTLRGVLEEAMAHGWLRHVRMSVVVPRYRADYQPRTTAPTPTQAKRLLAQLPAKRHRWVLLALTGLRPSEIERLDWTMISDSSIAVPGTKTPRSRRTIPTPTYLGFVDVDQPTAGRVVEPWSNVRRDLARACRRAGIPRFSPMDLRRAYATWLRAAGVGNDTIARLLGHAPGSAITANVYAQVPSHELITATRHLPVLGETSGQLEQARSTRPRDPPPIANARVEASCRADATQLKSTSRHAAQQESVAPHPRSIRSPAAGKS